ncbi:MAG TPA: phenylalanine--tRNA ligase beta subunit-related protein [bacterium]
METVLRLDPAITDRVRTAVLFADGIVVRSEDPQVWEEVDRVAAAYRAQWAGKAPGEIPELQPARELYRRTGVDPTKLRPSSEALLRRILRGEGLYRINSLVDTCNLCSLEFLLPIGLYDRGHLRGEVTARLGRASESYESLGKGLYAVEGRLALFDEDGPFGSPTNDSRRTAITEATTACLMVIFAPASYAPARLTEHAEHAANRLRAFASARTVAWTLNV